ncbi:hypothetical protein KSD_00920 [Ktedonobacter sp. SOSP1-85]|nr:hypothetical protein KSD_00920 [Ktedonobacter sp. SOSP1-85]
MRVWNDLDEQLLVIAVFEHNAHQILPVRGSVQEDEHIFEGERIVDAPGGELFWAGLAKGQRDRDNLWWWGGSVCCCGWHRLW